MNTNFKISAIKNEYNHLFNLSDNELFAIGTVKMIVDEKPGYPCRVSLEDAEIGEEVLFFPFQHHKTTSPYRSTGPVFVRKNARNPNLEINEIPEMLLHRLLSLRVYDKKGMMIAAKTIPGKMLKNEIEIMFNDSSASYIQIHNSSPGCYNCQVNNVK